MVNEHMLLVRDNVVINTNWTDCITCELLVGAGTTAYLFTILAGLESYAASNSWTLPVEQF